MQFERISAGSDDLPYILNELSLASDILYSADDSLENLEETVRELKELILKYES
ncbi:MAG: hypothetical protein LBD73_02070 [Deferribacteraceae bacterium]|jgi:archaellum component FlaC|nr:hypothetical protein [Deferribacteraceae bacterium]